MKNDFSDIAQIIEEERKHRASCYGSLAQSIFGEADRMKRKDIQNVVEDRERTMREALDKFTQ